MNNLIILLTLYLVIKNKLIIHGSFVNALLVYLRNKIKNKFSRITGVAVCSFNITGRPKMNDLLPIGIFGMCAVP